MLVRWGLIPAWVKDTREFPLLFNARSEGGDRKGLVQGRHAPSPRAGAGLRLLRMAADRTARRAQPYWMRPRHGGLVAFAGLIETYAEPGGSEMDTGAILTVNANADIAHIHDRMPVVIDAGGFARWLDCRTLEPRDVADLMRPAQPDFFEAIPVSDLVNKVANTGPEIQERGDVGPEPEKVRRQKPGADDSQMTLF